MCESPSAYAGGNQGTLHADVAEFLADPVALAGANSHTETDGALRNAVAGPIGTNRGVLLLQVALVAERVSQALVGRLTHIRDVARAFTHAIDKFEAMRGQPYNVGLSDANLSKAELCERIKAQLPDFVYLEAPVGEDPDKRDYIVSNARIEATGYVPTYSLDDGVRELIKGYRMIRNSIYGNM